MKSTIVSLIVLGATALQVKAHGYVAKVTIDGKLFIGDVPNGATNPSIVRQISDVSPVKGATNPDVNCGMSAQAASLVGSANPGSVLTFDWLGGDGSNWPHNTGPLLTYMASCGSTTCDKFDSTKAKWFKIQQVGRKSNGDWAQADLMAGGTAQVTLPATLAAGNYLIRNEIIALHLAETLGGAEFYPSCTQLSVGGSQSGAPKSSELVSLPGAYSDTDPGILDTNAYDASVAYTFPGPAIASFVSGTSSGSSSTSPSSSSSPSGSSSPSKSTSASGSTKTASSSPSASSATSQGYCSLKRPTASFTVAARALKAHNRPRRISRVMRDLFSPRHSSQ